MYFFIIKGFSLWSEDTTSHLSHFWQQGLMSGSATSDKLAESWRHSRREAVMEVWVNLSSAASEMQTSPVLHFCMQTWQLFSLRHLSVSFDCKMWYSNSNSGSLCPPAQLTALDWCMLGVLYWLVQKVVVWLFIFMSRVHMMNVTFY